MIFYATLHLHFPQVTNLIISYRKDMPDVAWASHLETFFVIATTDNVTNAIKAASNNMNLLHRCQMLTN